MSDKAILILAAGVALALYWLGQKAIGAAGAAAGAIGSAINPVNPGNVFYTGASAVSGLITGSKDSSLGSDFYDWINPGVDGGVTAPTPLPANVIDKTGIYSDEPVITSGSMRDLIH